MLKISIVQKTPMLNIEQQSFSEILEKYIRNAKCQEAQLVVFPEYCNVPINKKGLKDVISRDDLFKIFEILSKKYELWVCAGVVYQHRDRQKLYNSVIVFNDKGEFQNEYIKTHLIETTDEPDCFVKGNKPVIISTPWGNIGLAICYDIHFPQLFRNYAKAGADAIIIPSTVRKIRAQMWNVLIRARAYENHIYMIASNYTGENPNKDCLMSNRFKDLGGMSCIIDPSGKEEVLAGDTETVITANIDLVRASELKKLYPSLTSDNYS